MERVASQGHWLPKTWSVLDMTYVLGTCFMSGRAPLHCGPPRILCSGGAENAICSQGGNDGGHKYGVSSVVTCMLFCPWDVTHKTQV